MKQRPVAAGVMGLLDGVLDGVPTLPNIHATAAQVHHNGMARPDASKLLARSPLPR